MLTTCFSFQGRLGRARYVMRSLAVIIVTAITVRVLPSLVPLVDVPPEYQLLEWLMLASYGAATVAIMSFMARRLHDIGLSGWWTPSVMLLYVVQGFFQLDGLGVAAFVTGTGFAGLLLWIILTPGSKGNNSFGEPESSSAPIEFSSTT